MTSQFGIMASTGLQTILSLCAAILFSQVVCHHKLGFMAKISFWAYIPTNEAQGKKKGYFA